MLAQMIPELRRLPSREEEAALVREAQREPERFGRIFDLYFDAIHRFAVFHLRADSESAADIAQETFLRAFRALPSYRITEFPFSAWLYRIALNLLRNHATRRRPTVDLEQAIDRPGADVVEDRRWIRVFELAHDLPATQREVLSLRLGQGLTNEETAEILDRTVGSVKSLFVRALRTLEKRARESGAWM
jgi:RNA polymerase sigma-70 factor (ECF subfamily)